MCINLYKHFLFVGKTSRIVYNIVKLNNRGVKMSHYNEAVDFAQKLIQINTVESEASDSAPFGEGNAQALAFSLDTMQKMGFKTSNLENYCGYGEIGSGELFGILCHLDVVPVSDTWSVPPFGGEIKDGMLYGRGALDDKGPYSAALFAVKKLLDEGFTPAKRIRFILGCNEESGWKCMDRYSETEEMPAMGISPDAGFPVINCEKGILHLAITADMPEGLFDLQAGTRTNVIPDLATATVAENKLVQSLAKMGGLSTSVENGKLTLTAHGKSAHASTPEEGVNALVLLMGALGLSNATYNRLYAGFCNYDGSGLDLAVSDNKSGALTINLTTATIKNNKIEFTVDIRHPISITYRDILEKLKHEFSDWTITVDHIQSPLYVAPDHPLVATLLDAYNSVMGTNEKPIAIGGGTYARALPLGVAFGPVFPHTKSTIHQDDECVALSDFYKSIDIYYTAFKTLLFKPKRAKKTISLKHN